jgi:peptidoglycan/LPS O-acetylase OafA/YrhL
MAATRTVLVSERFRRTFARRTTSGRFIAEIDGLRFPAIAIVVIGHLSSFFLVRGDYPAPSTLADRVAASPERFASEGVLLFFIISGFVLALPFALAHRGGGEPVSLRSYFLRRLTRLEPPYLLTLVGLICLEIVAASRHIAGRVGTTDDILRHGAASAAYLHNMIYAAPSTINPPAWSLEIEVQFYVLVPLLALVFRIRSTMIRRGTIVVSALVAIGIQAMFAATSPRLSLSILGHAQFFLLGFLLADLYLFGHLRSSPRQLRWDLVSVVAWPSLFVLWQRGPWATATLPFVALVAFVAAFRGRATNAAFRNSWLTTLGGMCYSIYLMHFELIAAFARVTRRVFRPTGTLWLDMIAEGTPVLLMTLVVCAAFFYFVERPCMDRRWPQRLAAFVRRAPIAVAPPQSI